MCRNLWSNFGPDVCSDMCFAMYFDICFAIKESVFFPHVYCGIHFGTLSGIYSAHSVWRIFWHPLAFHLDYIFGILSRKYSWHTEDTEEEVELEDRDSSDIN